MNKILEKADHLLRVGTVEDIMEFIPDLLLFYTQIDLTWGQFQVNDGSWTKLDLSDSGLTNEVVPTNIFGWFEDGILDRVTEIVLTQDLLDHLLAVTSDYEGVTCSIIIQGEHLIFNKATIK